MTVQAFTAFAAEADAEVAVRAAACVFVAVAAAGGMTRKDACDLLERTWDRM